MNTNKTIKKYLDELSSSAPIPAGGNVAAFCGALAVSLGSMVCTQTVDSNDTAGKPSKKAEKEIAAIEKNLNKFRKEFEKLAQNDSEVFEKVIDSKNMPAETDKQRVEKRDAIENSVFEAAVAPSNVIKACKDLIPVLEQLISAGSEEALSDVGIAAKLTEAAAESAYLNVIANCSTLSNQFMANEFIKKSEVIYEEVKASTQGIISNVITKMRNV